MFFLALGALFSIIKDPKAALYICLLVFLTTFAPIGVGLLAQYFLGVNEIFALSTALITFIAGLFILSKIHTAYIINA